MQQIRLSPRAADAGFGRARRRVGQAGLDGPDRPREPARAAASRARFTSSIPSIAACSRGARIASLTAIAKPVDLALIATPARRGADGARRCGARGRQGGGHPFGAAGRRDRGEALAERRSRRFRPREASGCSDRIRSASSGPASDSTRRSAARSRSSGRLALIAQSGAVCAAMLDFATSVDIGFSTVVALGGAIDVGFGELLDALVVDPAHGRHPALRRSDRRRATLPVGVARRGADQARRRAARRTVDGAGGRRCAIARCGLRRGDEARRHGARQDVYAALRRGEDSRDASDLARRPARDRHQRTRTGNARCRQRRRPRHRARRAFAGDEESARRRCCRRMSRAAIRSTCAAMRRRSDRRPPSRRRSPIRTSMRCSCCTSRSPSSGATDAARAVAAVAARSTKPVLAAWLGAVDRREVAGALEAGGVANFYTPENAVEAFSFLAAYRHHQEWLLEVPPPQPEPQRARSRARSSTCAPMPHPRDAPC